MGDVARFKRMRDTLGYYAMACIPSSFISALFADKAGYLGQWFSGASAITGLIGTVTAIAAIVMHICMIHSLRGD